MVVDTKKSAAANAKRGKKVDEEFIEKKPRGRGKKVESGESIPVKKNRSRKKAVVSEDDDEEELAPKKKTGKQRVVEISSDEESKASRSTKTPTIQDNDVNMIQDSEPEIIAKSGAPGRRKLPFASSYTSSRKRVCFAFNC